MTPREKFIKCLKREPITGRVPHFELVFFLTMEVLGKVHPQHRNYSQWDQMSAREQELHIRDIASCYVDIAKIYGHSAIFFQTSLSNFAFNIRVMQKIREISGDTYFIMMHGDPTFGIPDGDTMMEFSRQMYEEEDALKAIEQKNVEDCLFWAEEYARHPGLLDGVALCSDYCFNTNPFFSPGIFEDLIAPYLAKVTKGYHDAGLYVIKHTDGNINPIVDQMVPCGPDALHSLDPQGGVDLKEIKQKFGDRVCLIGNVNCGLLQTGTEEACAEDVRRSLREGMPGYGYIFSTSNCVYTGLDLSRYELMHSIWEREGNYPDDNRFTP